MKKGNEKRKWLNKLPQWNCVSAISQAGDWTIWLWSISHDTGEKLLDRTRPLTEVVCNLRFLQPLWKRNQNLHWVSCVSTSCYTASHSFSPLFTWLHMDHQLSFWALSYISHAGYCSGRFCGPHTSCSWTLAWSRRSLLVFSESIEMSL